MRPNVIFIVADDLGYADLGCYGGRVGRFGPVSPHIDALANEGVRFTQGYSNSPVCSPTRFALMTARYQYRLRGGADEPINSLSRGSTVLGLPPEVPTLPSLLKESGYATALAGKWHLGYPPSFGPLLSGYESFFGPMSGGVDYFRHSSSTGVHDLWEGDEETTEPGYLTDLISERALQFIERQSEPAHHGKPFFLSVHYTAPHWPWETRDDAEISEQLGKEIVHLSGGNIHTYQRMIHHMDEGIGKMMSLLKAKGLDDNTLVIFTSDNGGERFSDNWPLVGGKMDLTEGGIRVPWIARWPQVIPSGSVSSQLCMTMDWSATIMDAAGVSAHADFPLDGVSLMPVLRQPIQTFPRDLYWRMLHREQRALRTGAYKYLRVDGIDYLFNLERDERERANLASQDPDHLARLRAQWEAWSETVPPIPLDAKVSLVYSIKDMPQR